MKSCLLLTILLTSLVAICVGFQKVVSANDMENPKVIKAISPPFIPYVFDKTGYETVSVEVQIDSAGNVSSAKTVEFTLFKDRSIEETAMKWKFDTGEEGRVRKAVLKFAFRIMPENTSIDELGTTFTFPYEIELRRTVIKSKMIEDPFPK
ncbi:MAG: hypothetical protein LC113_13315 [Acidobacteria bacterium]|nr:hypothetical protein [Acidobacteriota bacterium]